jgi:CMP-N,N'-diacetyllegionaminic acid synthase
MKFEVVYTLSMRSVIVIPARGGSKGIPKKNLAKIGSLSLLEIKIKQALVSQCGEVYVSTENEEIAEIAGKAGAKIIERPLEIANDSSSTEDVLLHAVEELNLGNSDVMNLLQVTSPLMRHIRINECFELLRNSSVLNSVLTVRLGHPFMWEKRSDFFEPIGHSRKFRPRRQDLPIQGWENGACYSMRVGALVSQQSRFPEPTDVVVCTFAESLDIDELEDLEDARRFI